MKLITITFFLFLFPLLTQGAPLILVLGEEKTLPPGESRLWIENPSRLKALPRGNRIVLKPLKTGQVQIRTSSGPHTVQIISPEAEQSRLALEKASENAIGLQVGLYEGEVMVEGRLHRLEDYRRLIRDLPVSAEWSLRAKMSPSVQEEFLSEVQKELSLPHPPALVFGDDVRWLVPSEKLPADLPQKRIRRLGLNFQIDKEAVSPEPVVRFEIAVAEVRRDALKSYGLGWPSSAEAKLLPEGQLQLSDMIFKAKAFESTGHGRLLAKPTILCRSGKEAEFVAGGEFPIKIFNEHIQDVVWKRYGIVVQVKPKADRAGRMSLGISVEVSSIDDARKVDGIPGLLTNRVASHFDLTKPRVIALSGLIKQEDGRSQEGLMGLGQIPLLGALFSSRDWREHRTELVIFVRPEIVKEVEP